MFRVQHKTDRDSTEKHSRTACEHEAQPAVKLDGSGKAVMDHIYDQQDPRAYCASLQTLRYNIPDAAQPVLTALLQAKRDRQETPKPLKLLDLGCSYGIIGRLLRAGISMDDACQHYAGMADWPRSDVVSADRKQLETQIRSDLSIVGLDISENACRYAQEAGSVDDTVVANLEARDLRNEEKSLIDGTDIAVSTGFIGYAGVNTMSRILEACQTKKPWMAHYVMRVFDFAEISASLREAGYTVKKGQNPAHQRTFASPAEQKEIVTRLKQLGIDTTGREDQGRVYADLFVCIPNEDRDAFESANIQAVLQ